MIYKFVSYYHNKLYQYNKLKNINMETLKNKLIRKWFKEYASELNSLLLLVPDNKYDEIKDLKEDLEICEKVFEKYNLLVN